MTRSIIQLAFAVLVMLAGAWLIGWWMVGVVLIVLGALVAIDAVLRDDASVDRRRQANNDVLERWRRAR